MRRLLYATRPNGCFWWQRSQACQIAGNSDSNGYCWSTGFSSGRGCDCLASPLSREVARTKFAHDEGIHPHTQQRCRAKHSGFIPVKKTYGEQERFPQLIRSRPLGLDLLRQTVDLGHRNLPSISGKVSAVGGCAIDPVKWGRNRRPSGSYKHMGCNPIRT